MAAPLAWARLIIPNFVTDRHVASGQLYSSGQRRVHRSVDRRCHLLLHYERSLNSRSQLLGEFWSLPRLRVCEYPCQIVTSEDFCPLPWALCSCYLLKYLLSISASELDGHGLTFAKCPCGLFSSLGYP